MHPRDIFAPKPDPDRRATDPEQIDPDESVEAILLADSVVRWRAEQFLALDFTPQQARVLALTRTVDLHYVRGLRAKGCDPMFAFDIVT